MSTLKTDIQRAADGLARELEELSRKIHDHPELGYQEVQACGWLSAFLEAKGFQVERGVGGVPTAFRATVNGAGDGPDGRDHVRVRRAAQHRARVRAQHHRDVRRRGGRGAGRRAVAAPGGSDPGDRHAGRGGRGREGEAPQGGRVRGRGLRDDDPRLRPDHPPPGSPRHRPGRLRVRGEGGPRRGRSLGRDQRARRLHPDVQRGQHAATAGAAGLPDPRDHRRTAGRRRTSSPSTRRRRSTSGRRRSTPCGSSTAGWWHAPRGPRARRARS